MNEYLLTKGAAGMGLYSYYHGLFISLVMRYKALFTAALLFCLASLGKYGGQPFSELWCTPAGFPTPLPFPPPPTPPRRGGAFEPRFARLRATSSPSLKAKNRKIMPCRS